MNNKVKEMLASYFFAILMFLMVFYFTSKIIYGAILGVLTFLLINFYLIKKLKSLQKLKKSLSKFSHLANSLIMQITVTPNVSMSMEAISDLLDEEERNIFSNDELLVKEKLDSIEKFYPFPLFQVFKEIIVLYDTQGGNIIDMSMQLLAQIDEYIKNFEVIFLDNNKKIGEVMILWCFSLIALFYIKTVLNDYYVEIIKLAKYQYIIVIFFLMQLLSVFIVAKKYIEVKVDE